MTQTPQLSENARTFLNEPRFGVMATINADGTPQQSVVWYELQGDEIMLNTKGGRLKDRNLRRDPRAALCIEDGNHYVALRGPVTLNDDQTVAQSDIERLAVRYDGAEKARAQVRSQFSREARVTIRLRPERIDEYGMEG
ncbi:MAG TPA: PPOX class F420-dependent oxidoreductase [Chloroflexota bacterium]